MRKFIKITSVFLLMIMCSCCFFASCSCVGKELPEYESGYYKYAVKTEKDGTKKAYITGLTEIGEEQEYLVYPEEIEGIPVYGIGYSYPVVTGYIKVGNFKSEKLKKFYFPHMLKEKESAKDLIIENAYCIYWNLAEDDLANNRGYGGGGAIFGYNYIEYDYWVKDYLPRFVGNVTYLYNYDGAPNDGYYWVDSYNESIIEFIPPEPQRNGYIFDGWYKESDCINEWNFDIDITGKEIKLEESKDYDAYEGIYLYAKWKEK